jgi:hypothetical protein
MERQTNETGMTLHDRFIPRATMGVTAPLASSSGETSYLRNLLILCSVPIRAEAEHIRFQLTISSVNQTQPLESTKIPTPIRWSVVLVR